MNEKGLMEQSNAAIKAALELYAADHGKLNDGDSFTTKLNNCVLTISLKDGSLDVQFDPDADVAVDTPYTLDMKLDIYNDLYIHVATGCTYQMPNDQRALVLARGMSDERPEKFAGNGKKPVRRGGS